MDNTKETILDELKEVIEEYLSRNPNLSLQSISDRSGVGYNTVRRIINRQTLPELTQVIKILGAISKENRLSRLISLYGGKLNDTLAKAFGGVASCSPDHVYDLRLDKALEDETSFIVYSLGANASGTTREQIVQVCGGPGIEALDKLIQSEFMYENPGKRIRAKNSFFIPSLDVMKKSICFYAKYFNTNHTGKVRNNLLTMSESINYDGLRKLHQLNVQYAKEVSEILNSKKYSGKIPVFSVAFTDTFVDALPEEDDEE